MVVDGDELGWLTGEFDPAGRTFHIHDQIEATGAPALLLEHYGPERLEYHDPWHRNREVSHLFRGLVDAFEADELLAGGAASTACGSSTTASCAAAPSGSPGCRRCAPTTWSPSGRVEGRGGRAPPAHPRLREGGLHRGRRLARGPRRGDARRDLLAGGERRRARPNAARGAAGERPHSAEAGHGPGVYEAVMTELAERRS